MRRDPEVLMTQGRQQVVTPVRSGGRFRAVRLALPAALLLVLLASVCLASTALAASTSASASASTSEATSSAATSSTPYAAGVEKGMWDDTWVYASSAVRDRILSEIADSDQLDASVVRLTLFWRELEPQEGVYNEQQIAALSTAIDAARAHGLRVILTFYGVPQWASDSTLWNAPPAGSFTRKTYYDFYIPMQSAMTAYEAFMDHLTKVFSGRIFAWECWNEPNIWWFWYPQTTSTNSHYGVDRYMDMLKRFATIVHRNDPAGLVLGGNTASLGYDNRTSTSPLTWAVRLKSKGAASWFDAYSHHPYAIAVGSSAKPPAPEQAPPDGWGNYIVTLGNIQKLLQKFPAMDFYLTEYGYNSKSTRLFGHGKVSETQEADYLRRAYRRCAKFPQIRLLTWYLRKDVTGGAVAWDPPMYSGLRRVSGSKKAAWWAFARHNTLTFKAPATTRRTANTVLTGKLTHAGTGVSARVLTVQKKAGSVWKSVATCRTRSDGSYKRVLRLTAATRLRVVWSGVVESPSRAIRVR
jgi:hypothetical protein